MLTKLVNQRKSFQHDIVKKLKKPKMLVSLGLQIRYRIWLIHMRKKQRQSYPNSNRIYSNNS